MPPDRRCSRRLKKGPLPSEQVLKIAIEVADASRSFRISAQTFANGWEF
jgi:hypothetical protein